ncbi:MAG: hypothetical protein PHE09_21315, partial [Oscillospiraceae bacterium]|nr:hypothetical protein [Oscillospiraceae bacterium]
MAEKHSEYTTEFIAIINPPGTRPAVFYAQFQKLAAFAGCFFHINLPLPAGLKMPEPHGAEWLRTYKSNLCGKEIIMDIKE